MAGLREALATHRLVVAPGVADPMTARLAARRGFLAVYVTGHGVSAMRYGLPDLGLIGRAEMADAVAVIAKATDLPVICDADTGYGELASVRETVRDLERAGASALHLEDQPFPKRCGYLATGALIDVEEMVARIEAARRARRSADLLLIARTEARLAADFDETVARARRYHEAGADLIFVNAPPDEDAAASLPQLVPAPLVHNNAGTAASPTLDAARAAALGYRLLIYPTHLVRAAVAAAEAVLGSLAEDGVVQPTDPRTLDFASWLDLTGVSEAETFESACRPEASDEVRQQRQG